MSSWTNFYLQRMGTDADGADWPVCESVSTWGVFCKDIPFVLFEKAKEPAKRTWIDEDGDDEYIPSTGLRMEAYTMKVEFGCKRIVSSRDTATYGTRVSDVRERVGAFLKYLREGGLLKMYSSYTRIGRQNVRLDSVDSQAVWKSKDGVEYLVFGVTFKVNDPVTEVVIGV